MLTKNKFTFWEEGSIFGSQPVKDSIRGNLDAA